MRTATHLLLAMATVKRTLTPTSDESMKTAVILDSDLNSTHPMEAVLDRRGFVVLRAGTTEEAIKLLTSDGAPVDLVLCGSGSQTEAAVQIDRSSPGIPILLVSDLSLDKWPEDDFLRFGQLLSGRIDLLVKPLSQASFMSKANAPIYTVSYGESNRLFESPAARRLGVARV
jgi:hypothetical protein